MYDKRIISLRIFLIFFSVLINSIYIYLYIPFYVVPIEVS